MAVVKMNLVASANQSMSISVDLGWFADVEDHDVNTLARALAGCDFIATHLTEGPIQISGLSVDLNRSVPTES